MTGRTPVLIRRLLLLVVIAALGAITTPAVVAQICVNCGGPVGFRLHAFDGLIAPTGGKCLDYQPEDAVVVREIHGETWFVACDSPPFVAVNTSSFRVSQLRFGDFDGSGTTDVFGVGSRDWQVSYSATSGWDALRSRLTNTATSLHVADFEGNGTADVATLDIQAVFPGLMRYRWRVSRDGIGGRAALTPPTFQPPAAIGAFVADDPRAGFLQWNENAFWRASYGESTLTRHSRQHMR